MPAEIYESCIAANGTDGVVRRKDIEQWLWPGWQRSEMVKAVSKEEQGFGANSVNLETEAERIYHAVSLAFSMLEGKLKRNGVNLEFTRFEFQPTHLRDENYPSVILYDITLDGKEIF